MMANASVKRVNQGVVHLRAEPHQASEVVSQAIMSEEVRLLDESYDWLKVETAADGYHGWTRKEGICSSSNLFNSLLDASSLWTNRLSAHVYHTQDTIYGPIMTLPYGSRLALARSALQHDERWLDVILPDGKEAYIQRGDVVLERPLLANEQVERLALTFLGLPYTWGGRSSFGYDCSGFVQMLYASKGVVLPRDSKDQALAGGFSDAPLSELQKGDLVFFGSADKTVKHVGFSLGGSRFIHTCAVVENAPYVRISSLEDPAWNGGGYYPYRFGKRYRV